MPWGILLNKYVLGGIAIAFLLFFLHHAKETYDESKRQEGRAPLEAAIAKQKQEAAAQLLAKVKENELREAQDRQKAVDSERNYREKLSDYEKKLAATRANSLRFAADRSRTCGDGPGKEGSTSTGATKDVSVEGGVPDEIRAPLVIELPADIAAGAKALMVEADRLAIWGESCFKRVNGL